MQQGPIDASEWKHSGVAQLPQELAFLKQGVPAPRAHSARGRGSRKHTGVAHLPQELTFLEEVPARRAHSARA